MDLFVRYQRSARCEHMGYEDDLLKYLNTVISEADKRIVRGNQRLLMANTEHTVVSFFTIITRLDCMHGSDGTHSTVDRCSLLPALELEHH